MWVAWIEKKAEKKTKKERGSCRLRGELSDTKPRKGRPAAALVFGQIAVLETEVALLPLAPRAFPVEVDIHALLVLLRDCLRFRVPLEPCQVLDMETPGLSLELLRSEVPTTKEVSREEVNSDRRTYCWYVPGW